MSCNCLCILLHISFIEWQNTVGYDAKYKTAFFVLDGLSPIPHDKMLLVLPFQDKSKPADGSNEKQSLHSLAASEVYWLSKRMIYITASSIPPVLTMLDGVSFFSG